MQFHMTLTNYFAGSQRAQCLEILGSLGYLWTRHLLQLTRSGSSVLWSSFPWTNTTSSLSHPVRVFLFFHLAHEGVMYLFSNNTLSSHSIFLLLYHNNLLYWSVCKMYNSPSSISYCLEICHKVQTWKAQLTWIGSVRWSLPGSSLQQLPH